MTTAVVVGGGIAGLLAAKLLRRRHERVLLIERDAGCGGLLGSVCNPDGVVFDHGAHVLSETGVADIDALLYGNLKESDWHSFHILRAGNWFGGAMNRTSPFPDGQRIGEAMLRVALDELAHAALAQHAEPRHLAEALRFRFGSILAEKVAGPAVRKQLGVEPEQLHPLTPFAIRRIVVADAENSQRLKQDARFSEPVAFASYDEGVGKLLHRYPRNGGIGQWVNGFVEELQRDGVEVLCGHTVTAITHGDGTITSVTLNGARQVECARLAWTLPSAMLLRAAGIAFEGKPPLPRPIGLFHLVFDSPFDDPNYHITCYDESLRTFRVTLYPNVRGQPEHRPFNCTVEVVGEAETDFPAMLPQVVAELKTMGIAPASAQLLSSLVRTVPMGFPATTPDFMASQTSQAALAQTHLQNALLLGRARCPPFFTSDVLVNVFHTIEALANE